MWIVSKQSTQEELANTFRKLMKAPDILKIPGVHDGMAAITAKTSASKRSTSPGQPTRQAADSLTSE